MGVQQFLMAQSARYTVKDGAIFNGGYNRLLRINSAAYNTYTWALWVKRNSLTGYQGIFANLDSGGNSKVSIEFESGTNKFWIYDNAGGNATRRSATVFNSTSVWYHLVYNVNAGVPTLYVNGALDTAWAGTLTSVAVNDRYGYGGYDTAGPSSHLDATIAEAHYVQGLALGPSNFGETRGGVWVPKKYTGSYGTNGVYLGAGIAAGTDASGNGNNMTKTGTVTATTISPALGA